MLPTLANLQAKGPLTAGEKKLPATMPVPGSSSHISDPDTRRGIQEASEDDIEGFLDMLGNLRDLKLMPPGESGGMEMYVK